MTLDEGTARCVPNRCARRSITRDFGRCAEMRCSKQNLKKKPDAAELPPRPALLRILQNQRFSAAVRMPTSSSGLAIAIDE